MADELDDIIPLEILRVMAKVYASILEAVIHKGAHGIDSAGLEAVRLDCGTEKHLFVGMLSQLCQGGLIATDDQEKFFATPHAPAFVKVFRNKQKELEAKKVKR